MTSVGPTRIAFLGSRGARAAHYDGLDALVPQGVEIATERLGLPDEAPEDLAEAEDLYVAMAVAMVQEHDWKGVALTGGPTHVRHPAALGRVRSAVDIPVTSPLEASAAALHALGVRRALLLTPFDEAVSRRVQERLTATGIDAVLPAGSFGSTDEAAALGPDAVYGLARDAFEAAPEVDGIYFQGARLDPLPVLERIERDLDRPVVASNPAMLWYLLGKLGQRHKVDHGGRLLREWPGVD